MLGQTQRITHIDQTEGFFRFPDFQQQLTGAAGDTVDVQRSAPRGVESMGQDVTIELLDGRPLLFISKPIVLISL